MYDVKFLLPLLRDWKIENQKLYILNIIKSPIPTNANNADLSYCLKSANYKIPVDNAEI